MSRINFSALLNDAGLTPEAISTDSLVQAIAEDGDKCDCASPMYAKGSAMCDYCGKLNEAAEEAKAANAEPHQLGCICADCSGAELTAEND